jgi:putative PEP-CTERM system TPR-repeat lipoprotein
LRDFPAGHRLPAVEAEVRVLRGRALLDLNQTRNSEEEFLSALSIKPDFVKGLIGLASLRMATARMEDAEDLLGRAMAQEPDNEAVWHMKGKINLSKNDWQGALSDFEKTLTLAPANLVARVDRASVYLITGRRDDALKDLDIVRKDAPKYPRAGLLRALALVQMGERRKALAMLDDVALWIGVLSSETFNNDPQSLLLMGAIHYSLKRYEDAIPYLLRYNELAPHTLITRKMMGMIYMMRGDHRSALELLEPLLARAPKDLQLLTALGRIYTKAKEYGKATELFEKAASIAPQNTATRTELGLNRLATGQLEKARGELEEAVRLGKGRGRAGAFLGLLHLRRGDTKSALEIADRLSKAEPKNPFPHNLAGSAHIQDKAYVKARKSFLAALEVAPDYEPAVYNLATVARLLDGPAAAKEAYLAILKKDQTQVKAMSELATLSLKEGNTRDAINWLDRASKTSPTAIKPQLRLVNLLIQKRQLAEARQIMESLENRAPRNLSVLDAKARIQLATGNQADAIQTYRNAANVAADNAAQLFRIAKVQISLQDVQGAASSLKYAVNLDPTILPAQAALARLTYDIEGFDAAMKMVAALQEKFPGSPAADTVKGDVLMRNKRYAEAIASYEAAFAKSGTSNQAQRLFQARWASGDRTAALGGLDNWVKSNPKNLRPRRVLALAYLKVGNTDLAISHHEALAQMSPQDVVIINNLAGLYYRRGDKRALEFAERAYELAPQQPHTIDTYGWMLVQKGEVKKGLRLLRNAQARSDNQPDVGYHIAVALDALGRQKEAMREIEAVLALGKKFKDEDAARKLLERLKQKK